MSVSQAQFATQVPPPPRAEQHPKDVTVHGDKRIDDFFWLREKSNPAVLAYLKSENAYADAVMAPNAGLREKLFQEILGRIKETDARPPVRKNGYWYYSRTEKGKQYRILARKKGNLDAPEQITLDVNALGAGKPFMAIGDYEVSDDAQQLAYTTDSTGYRQYDLFLKNLATGQTRDLHLPRVTSVVWAADNRTLFVTQEDPVSKRSYRLGRIDAQTGDTQWLLEEPDVLYGLTLGRSLDGAYLFCTAFSKVTTELRALPSEHPAGEWKIIAPRRDGVEIYGDYRAGRFYFRTNDGAKNFRLVSAPVAAPERAHWKDVLPGNPDIKLTGFLLFHDFTVVSELEKGLPHLRVIDDRSGQSHRIATAEPVYELALEKNEEADTAELRYTYQSMVTPLTVVSYRMDSRQATVLKQDEIPSGYDSKLYASERLWAKAKDGTEIPLSVVYRRDRRKAGPQPLWLYGYGSYGIAMPVTFSPARLSLLDRGFIFVIAHIRGGGELGEPWRDAGKMATKMNTFTDFIACAEDLIARRYTTSSELVIHGGSAGGLLMGAVVNLRPDLFKAAIYDVPFVDVVNTMLDETLPLTTEEFIEWGNPKIAEQYRWIRAYSPYDNLHAANYPNILVEVSLNDSQVPYWEGAKLVAKLRTLKTDHNVLLLHSNLSAGHGGASGRYDALHETAYRYAFALSALGLAE